MKKVLLLTVAMMLVASMAFAQGGHIGLYADVAGTDCFVVDAVPGLVFVYVIHELAPGTTAAQWRVQNNSAMSYLGFSLAPTFLMLGDPSTGAAISYGACLASPIAVGTLQYFASGVSAPCTSLQVVPDPTAISGTIEVVDCALIKHIGTGGIAIVNSDATCHCLIDPVEETTWGRLKSFYD